MLTDTDVDRIAKAVWAEHDCKFTKDERAELHQCAEFCRFMRKLKITFYVAIVTLSASAVAWVLIEGLRAGLRK